MANILIRDVPEEVLAAIDAKAKRIGLSRTEYLRRALERQGLSNVNPISVDQLVQFAALVEDLYDPAVMSGAWS